MHVDDAHGAVRRPPGIELDTGGTGKGLAADARRAPPRAHGSASRWTAAATCASAATAAQRTPYEVEVAHPFGGEPVHRLWLGPGAIATSGIDSRLWQRPDGTFAHHLIDPLTGAPAWTGPRDA